MRSHSKSRRVCPWHTPLFPIPRSQVPRCPRRAYTLTELLIVITIMIMLMGLTLPAVKQVMRDSGVREASRQLNAYFAMAKARALLTGRPCGVMMRCDLPTGGTDPTGSTSSMPAWPARQVTQLYLAEVPPPYAGGTIGAKGRIMASPTLATNPTTYEFIPLDASGAVDSTEVGYLCDLIAIGEKFTVRFDNKGAWYECQRQVDSNGVNHFLFQTNGDSSNGIVAVGKLLSTTSGPVFTGVTSTNEVTPIPPAMTVTLPHAGHTFQITRLPRRIGNPLELAQGTCIDVTYSGIGPMNLPTGSLEAGMYPALQGSTVPSGLFAATPPNLQYLTVMFEPGGGIESVYLNNYSFIPQTTVHFLVGKTDKVTPPLGTGTSHPTGKNMFDIEVSNLIDPLSLWVSVARTTGNVNTSENAPPDLDRVATSATSITINPGPNQEILNPNSAAHRAYLLSLCRRLATNREQVRGQ